VAEYRAQENAEQNPLYRAPIVPLFLSKRTRQAANRIAADFQIGDVRFTSESRHAQHQNECLLCAISRHSRRRAYPLAASLLLCRAVALGAPAINHRPSACGVAAIYSEWVTNHESCARASQADQVADAFVKSLAGEGELEEDSIRTACPGNGDGQAAEKARLRRQNSHRHEPALPGGVLGAALWRVCSAHGRLLSKEDRGLPQR